MSANQIKKITIRSYQKGDENGIVDLLVRVFDGWPHLDLTCSPLEHWKWKYLDNPLRKSIVALAKEGDKTVGADHGFILKMKIGGMIVTALQGADAAIQKEYQGEGLFSKVLKCITDQYPQNGVECVYYSTTSPSIIRMSEERRTPEFPHKTLSLVKIRDFKYRLKMNPAKNQTLLKIGYQLIKNYNKIINRTGNLTTKNTTFKIKEVTSFNDNINTFWNEISENYDLIAIKNMEYLNWRYCDERGGKYMIYIAKEKQKIVGYIVLRVNKYNKDYSQGWVVDLVALSDRTDVMLGLMREAEKYFEINSINETKIWVTKNSHLDKLSKSLGYVNDGTKLRIYYRPLSSMGDIELFQRSKPDQIHFTIGDTDWI